MKKTLLLSFLAAAAIPVHAQVNYAPAPGSAIQTSMCRFMGKPVTPRAEAVRAYFDAKSKAQLAESVANLFRNSILAPSPEKAEEARAYAAKAAEERDAARARAISLGGMRDAAEKDEDYACRLSYGVDYVSAPAK